MTFHVLYARKVPAPLFFRGLCDPRRPPAAGAYVVRPPGQHPSRNIRVLTELLIETCDNSPYRVGLAGVE
ncbi:hypothetical protein CAL25_05205 [Bordetella genomosp. 5]|uniref:Uncharacterized protein n=1 Tax=Bordetella genomosp. 5 TaxID=1395608 RepID=A0A261TWV2_9BORD|nr:hypothetical protein CAL25_05205 [Bordetella genomosp. 5]